MSKNITPEELLKVMQLEKGDIVLMASDMVNLCIHAIENSTKFNMNNFIDLMQQAITPSGTLLFPTYTWKFCHNHPK